MTRFGKFIAAAFVIIVVSASIQVAMAGPKLIYWPNGSGVSTMDLGSGR